MLPLGLVVFPYLIKLLYQISNKQNLYYYFSYGFFYGLDLGSFGLRSIETGTMAVIHVATSKHLADRGGNLYSDSSGIPFINCGLKSQIDCGRVSRAYQPAEAQNIQLGSELFKWTKNKLKNI